MAFTFNPFTATFDYYQAAASGVVTLAPTETPDGSLKVFTFSAAVSQPSFIISDGTMLEATSKSGTTNWTWNNATTKATMTIPPLDDILGIV